MIDSETRVQICRFYFAEHWKVGTIAAELHIHPDTVRRAIDVEKAHNVMFPRAVSAVSARDTGGASASVRYASLSHVDGPRL